MRPINNIVDVTNFVMMETGQPLHAFDYDKFDRHEIVVRCSKSGETFTTLDGKDHVLPEQVVLITDGAKTIALGGIMGGLNSEVDDSTTTVLLESAYFNPRRTRRASKALGIDSEAALRFEKGTDPNMVPYALDRAAHLLARLGGGHVRKGSVDQYPEPIVPHSLTLRVNRTNKILGLNLTAEEMAGFLRSISLQADPTDDRVTVRVPTFRPDLEREIDLVEEVARLFGYENIPVREEGGGRLFDVPDHDPAVESIIHRQFSSRGFNEAVTRSMGSEAHYRVFEPDLKPIRIANPLSEELSHLRTSLLADLVATAEHNFNHRNLDWRLYTLGTVFLPRKSPEPEEELHLGLALAGAQAPRFWLDSERPAGWYDLKGAIADLFTTLRVPQAHFKATAGPGFVADACFAVLVGEREVGVAGRLDARAAKPWDVKEDLWLAELKVGALTELRGEEPVYQPLPRFPAVSRDLALVVDDEVLASDLVVTLQQAAGPLLAQVELFDLYRGKPLPAGKKSMAFNLVFQSHEKSLEAEEVDGCIQDALKAAQAHHCAQLRT
jgi:phenylalanyl-tRNA synthetase beta chain